MEEDGELRDTSRDEKRRLEREDADRDAKRLKSEGEGGSSRVRGASRDRSRERRDEKKSREDRDKGRDRSRERDKPKRDGDKGRDKSPLSKGVSSGRDRAKDRDGDRPRSDRERERSKDRDREKEKKKDRGDRLDRIRDDTRDKPKDREASSRGGDRRDRDRDDKDRGRDRERGARDDDSKRRGDRDGDRRDKDRARERDRGSRSEDKGRKERDGDRRDDRRDGGREGATKQEEQDDPMDQSIDFDAEDEEDKEEQLRLKREAILAKYKAKSVGGAGAGAGDGAGSKSPKVTPAAAAPAAPSAPAHASGTNGDAASEEKEDAAEPVKEADRVVQEGTAPTTNGDEGEDDMFSLTTPIRGYAPKEEDGLGEADERAAERNDMDRRMGVTNADNWDDAEGYFKTRPGEVIANRYKVMRDIGHGVYSTVVSASDEQQGNMEVAIKLIRSNETMYKAGRKEIDILKKLATEDPENKRHICRLLSHFEYKNHLCMVFVPAEMNLRKLLKTYGREVGISLQSIKVYAKQLLIGLHHMIKCQVVHGDIKLDNILITKDLKTVSICDFGTADWTVECTITPYMVSRYYRPPEIVLGLRYGHPMDLWSVGVCLFELYTGKFMFTGRNNNEMLKQFMDYKGAPPKKILKHAQFKDQHFEEEKGNLMFKYLTKDIVTKQEIIQKINYDKPTKSIIEQLRKVRSSGDDLKKIKEFADLLEGIFILDPAKRISVSEALKHPFLN